MVRLKGTSLPQPLGGKYLTPQIIRAGSTELRREQAQERRQHDALAKMHISEHSPLLQRKVDPVTVLPTEVMGAIFQCRPNLKSIIGLERVSKAWSEAIRLICSEAWISACWGVDADLCWNEMREEKALDEPGQSDWRRIKQQIMSYHNMRLGFPRSVFSFPDPRHTRDDGWGESIVRRDYFACLRLRDQAYTLMICPRDPELAAEGLLDYDKFTGATYLKCCKISQHCGLSVPFCNSGDANNCPFITFVAAGPEQILLYFDWSHNTPSGRSRENNILVCISTTAREVIWARSELTDWRFPAAVPKDSNGRISMDRNHQLEFIRNYPEIQHTNSCFLSHLARPAGHHPSWNPTTDYDSITSTVLTLDLRSGNFVDILTHEINIISSNLHNAILAAIMDINLPQGEPPNSTDPDEHHPSRFKIVVKFDSVALAWTAAVHDLLHKRIIGNPVTLSYPSSYSSRIRPESPTTSGPIAEASALISTDVIRLSSYSPSSSNSPTSIFVTFTNRNAKSLIVGSQCHKRSWQQRTHHLSFTLHLTKAGILSLHEINIYNSWRYPYVNLNPRTRLGVTCSLRDGELNCDYEDRPIIGDDKGRITLLTYTEELAGEKDEEEELLGVRKWIANVFEEYMDGPKTLMAAPKDVATIDGYEKKESWEKEERGKRDEVGSAQFWNFIRDVGEGVLVTMAGVYCF
ncbi:hypothetical protein BJ508DRAFT_358718 [Ascobolus immersus RN42]|uniref:F-box domain-containing protein n=1 Tax=Ascobolus immersus RN42 TaxID=1160509 RepID=A0A3N4IM50_ASCIM|nr:hypothetical protein BJ508DRAFT_358718 [Ascobolus immersus RN42]